MKMIKEKRYAMKIVIIGGVAGGATTVTRLRRLKEDAQIIMIERGKHISFANFLTILEMLFKKNKICYYKLQNLLKSDLMLM